MSIVGCMDHASAVFRYVGETGNLLWVVLDRNGRIIDCNRAFLRLIATEEKPTGREISSYLSPDSRILFRRWFQNPRNGFHLEFSNSLGDIAEYVCFLEKNGEAFLFFGEQKAVSASDIIAQMSTLTNQLTDATRELHKKNRELRVALQAADKANRAKSEVLTHLEDLVRKRTADLEKAMIDAEAANQAKTSFLANMTHELRTPMNAIMGFTYLIKNGPLTSLQAEQLNGITTAAQRLMQLINNILDFSRIDDQPLTPKKHDFEPARIMEEVHRFFSDRAAAKNLDWTIDLDDIPAMIQGDDEILSRILHNLIDNAVKFTENGSITITMRIVSTSGENITLRCEIQDTGIGMTPEQMAHAFQIFQQADSSMTRRFGGMGLGLAISQRLVERLNGRIGMESDTGCGTTVWMEIPFLKSPLQTARIPSVPSSRQIRKPMVDTADQTVCPHQKDHCHPMDISEWPDTDIQKLIGALNRLDALLADDNTSSGELFDEFKSLLQAAFGPTADRIGRQIQGFDFADALNSLREARRALVIPGEKSNETTPCRSIRSIYAEHIHRIISH